MKNNSKKRMIIIAADFSDLHRLVSLVESLADEREKVGYKIGFTLALRYGLPHIVKTLRSVGARLIIYDHQKGGTDIPQMGEKFAAVCGDSGIDGAILFPHTGPKTLAAFVAALQKTNVTPIVGGHMTHSAYLSSDGGYIADNAPQRIYQEAAALGVKDIVIPGNQLELMAKYVELFSQACTDPGFWFPGIGRQGGDLKKAISAVSIGRAYPIVGTAIYDSEDPINALRSLMAQLN
jgi:orotidine-5'-phosphate decarboxylase